MTPTIRMRCRVCRLAQARLDGDSYLARRDELVAAVEEVGQQLAASARRVADTEALLAAARQDAAVAQARIDEYESKVEASRAEAEKVRACVPFVCVCCRGSRGVVAATPRCQLRLP